ncbi:MAG TPA: hypothetical protein VFN30_04290 [Chitinophagaceae bacterium]|nr:hypothetical protein [Chitinophagaceae bacterium]
MELELKNHRIEIVKNIILQVFSFLEEQYLYTPKCKVEGDDIFIESFEVEYVHETKRRKIAVSYTKSQVYSEIKYTFSVSITRIPYSGVEDFFSLSNYLQSNGKDFSSSLINDFSEAEAEMILRKIAAALKEHVLEIIDGTEWLETYYPRKD